MIYKFKLKQKAALTQVSKVKLIRAPNQLLRSKSTFPAMSPHMCSHNYNRDTDRDVNMRQVPSDLSFCVLTDWILCLWNIKGLCVLLMLWGIILKCSLSAFCSLLLTHTLCGAAIFTGCRDNEGTCVKLKTCCTQRHTLYISHSKVWSCWVCVWCPADCLLILGQRQFSCRGNSLFTSHTWHHVDFRCWKHYLRQMFYWIWIHLYSPHLDI